MSKKKTSGGSFGRSLIKDRFGNHSGKKMVSDNQMLHTTELDDGFNWSRLNLQSVTEESSFQEFLSTAELAGTEFQAERLNIKFVNPQSNVGLLSAEEIKKLGKAHKKFKDSLKIPRRPPWTPDMSVSELDNNEKQSFLEWRRSLAALQENEGLLLTPYEKNLEFWRQLWRVVERSDVVVQIVDARNPLLFYCEDLQKYVTEVSPDKTNLVLINKADFLTEQQRKYWADYFDSLGLKCVFFSATSEAEKGLSKVKEDVKELDKRVEEQAQLLDKILDSIGESIEGEESSVETSDLDKRVEKQETKSSVQVLTTEQLFELFLNVHKGPRASKNLTIGLVGYPNVGKSSTINALLSSKKVSVSATPGKTKHFQTLYLDKDVVLCDCPGLVMPSFVFTKADMILNGILPVDQMKDHVPPVNLVAKLIPRHVIEDKYGIILPSPLEGEDPDRSPTSEELLNVYAYNRGFMTANGQPDNARAARYVLKDFINGKLLYCHAPPNVDQKDYHTWPQRQRVVSEKRGFTPREARAAKPYKLTTDELDRGFFKNMAGGVHVKGKAGIFNQRLPAKSSEGAEGDWKSINKHRNKNKREKIRRVYAHLDQH